MMNSVYRFMIIVTGMLLFACLFSSVAHASRICYKCHKKQNFTNKVVHAPVAKGDCSACHNPHVAKYPGLLIAQGAALCFRCHGKMEKEMTEGIVHAPVRSGDCALCHDPHSSALPGLLGGKTSSEQCLKCHTSLAQSYKVTHRPFAKGQCSACHAPHQSKYMQLLKQEGDRLCAQCHTLKSVQAAHRNYPAKIANCVSCHNPHGSERKGLVRNVLHKPYGEGCKECHGRGESDEESCLRCHEETRKQFNAQNSHLISGKGNSCIACHSPHAGDDAALLRGAEKNSCRQCHENTFQEREHKPHRHPGLNKCSNCHAPHGSNELAMMKSDHNGVCSACHKSQGKFTHPVGEKIADPRTGQHLTCVSCHNPMGTDFKFHLKASGTKALCVQCHRSY